MSKALQATKRLVNKGIEKPARFNLRARYGEFVVRDGSEEIAVCEEQARAEDIVDALNLLHEKEGKR